MQATHEPAWYILYTKRRLEKKVMQLLTRKKIVHYCPINKIRQQYLNRTTIICRPLFPSFVFIHTTPDSFKTINRINSVLSLVHRLESPATVSNNEINGIKKFLESHDSVVTRKMPVSFADLSPTGVGPMIEQEGLNYFATLNLHSLGYALKASVSHESVKPADVVFLNEQYQAFTVNMAN
ncbi:MAG: transcription termination/antitermination NusG family protein [Chitinophagaceae bacterium]